MEEMYKKGLWERRKGLDLWSVPHFLFGVLMAAAPPLLDVSLLTALALTVVLALLWELYEKIVGIQETLLNGLFDLILPIMSFALTSYALRAYPLEIETLQNATGAVFALYMVMNLWGWFAHLKRKQAARERAAAQESQEPRF